MAFFKDPAVEKKYANIHGDRDPKVRVVIGYVGPLSGAPMHIADKLHAGGSHITLKKDIEKDTEKPPKPIKKK